MASITPDSAKNISLGLEVCIEKIVLYICINDKDFTNVGVIIKISKRCFTSM